MHLRGRAEQVGVRRFASSTSRPRSRGACVAELAQPAARFREIARGKLGDARIAGARSTRRRPAA